MEPVCTIDACVRDAITWWALNKHTHGLVSGATAADVAAAAELLDSLPPPSATSGSAPTGLSIASSDPTDIARSRPSPQVRPSRTPPHSMGHHSASQHAQERGSYPTRSRAHGGHALRRKACPHRQRAAGREYRVGTRCLDRPWIRRRGPRGACPVSTWRQLGPGPGAPRVGRPAGAPHHSLMAVGLRSLKTHSQPDTRAHCRTSLRQLMRAPDHSHGCFRVRRPPPQPWSRRQLSLRRPRHGDFNPPHRSSPLRDSLQRSRGSPRGRRPHARGRRPSDCGCRCRRRSRFERSAPRGPPGCPSLGHLRP